MGTMGQALSRPARVLVAEDDDSFCERISAALPADGHLVTAVRNGIDQMDVLVMASRPETGAAPFDLVISDVRMPGITGVVVISHLTNVIRLPPVGIPKP